MDIAQVLLELQNIDTEIMRAGKRLEETPEKTQILRIRAKRTEVQEKKDQAGHVLRSLQGQVKAFEDETAMIDEKLVDEQRRLNTVTDHRSAQSITKEMGGLERRKNKIEFDEMALLEKIEKASGIIAQIDEMLSKLDEQESQVIERFQLVGGGIQQEIAELRAAHATLAAGIPADVLAHYEKARATFGGLAVCKLEAKRCSVCRIDLPASHLEQLRTGAPISECPSCHRMMIVRTVSQ